MKPRSVCILFAFALPVVAASDETIQYSIKGNCLAHEAGAVEFYTPNRPTRGGKPLFLVPAPYPTVSKGDADDRTGIAVSYAPVSEAKFAKRTELRINPAPGACLEQAFENGLARLATDPDYKPEGITIGRCIARLSPHIKLVPQDTSIPLRLRCLSEPQAVSCQASYFMDNGWEAKILFRRSDLADWQTMLALASDYFEQNLQDCGKPE